MAWGLGLIRTSSEPVLMSGLPPRTGIEPDHGPAVRTSSMYELCVITLARTIDDTILTTFPQIVAVSIRDRLKIFLFSDTGIYWLDS
jgi:hypothetical protein